MQWVAGAFDAHVHARYQQKIQGGGGGGGREHSDMNDQECSSIVRCPRA